MRNGADARSWPQVTLCNFRVASNWPLLLESERLLETARETVLLIKIGDFSEKAKTSPKHRVQLSCCLKLASKHSAQLSFCLKWVTFYIKLNLVQNIVRNPAVAQNWPDVGLRNCRFA